MPGPTFSFFLRTAFKQYWWSIRRTRSNLLATVRSTWTLYFDKLGFAKAGGEKYRGFIPYDQSLEVRIRNLNERSLTKDGPGQG